jgi:hypothetical protein
MSASSLMPPLWPAGAVPIGLSRSAPVRRSGAPPLEPTRLFAQGTRSLRGEARPFVDPVHPPLEPTRLFAQGTRSLRGEARPFVDPVHPPLEPTRLFAQGTRSLRGEARPFVERAPAPADPPPFFMRGTSSLRGETRPSSSSRSRGEPQSRKEISLLSASLLSWRLCGLAALFSRPSSSWPAAAAATCRPGHWRARAPCGSRRRPARKRRVRWGRRWARAGRSR